MHMVKIHEAKTHLSRLVEDVQAGGEVIISRGVKPVARLTPYLLKSAEIRKLVYLKGRRIALILPAFLVGRGSGLHA